MNLVASALLAFAMTGAAAAQQQPARSPAPAVVTARVLGADAAAPPDAAGFLIEIADVRSGSVPGSVAAVRAEPGSVAARLLAEAAREPGAGSEPLHLTLVDAESGDGAYLVRHAEHAGGEPPADPLPPPLAADPVAPPPPAGLREKATPGAPFTHQVLEIVNEERAANGNLAPLKGVAALDSAAGTHSANMAVRDFFAHCDVDTKTQAWDRMSAAGYAWSAAGENIAAGQGDPQTVMAAWMASPGHRANILSTNYRELGVGYELQSNDQPNVRLDQNGDCTADGLFPNALFHYWTQNFGRRSSVYPVIIEREDWETSCQAVDLYVYGAGFAQEMRFSNNGTTWSAWEPYAPAKTWNLAAGASGTATVWAEIRNGATVRQATDTINLTGSYPAPATVDLSGQTVTGTMTWTACDTLTAGSGFRVAATGDVTFRAGRKIILRDGFSVAAGGGFRAGID